MEISRSYEDAIPLSEYGEESPHGETCQQWLHNFPEPTLLATRFLGFRQGKDDLGLILPFLKG
jgi:hypothetical protein